MYPVREINLPALRFAMQTRDIHVAKIVLGTNIDNYSYKNPLGETLLHLSVKHNFQDLIEWLIHAGLNINSFDSSHRTPLHLAITTKNEAMIRYLLSFNASTDIKDLYGKSPFHIAVQSGDTRLVALFLDHGANILDATLTTEETAFHIALKNEDEATFNLLLKNHRGSVNAADEYGETLLHTLARKRKYAHLAELLLEKGGDLELLNKDNETALHFAIHNRNFNIARIFIDHGANVNARNRYGESPLHLAIRHRELNLVNLLVRNDADVNECTNDANTMLHLAVNYYNEDIVKLLLENNVDIESRNSCDLSPFHLAIKNRCIAGARVLLVNNADVNTLAHGKLSGSERSYTPLHTAIVQKDTKAVEFLLENGAEFSDSEIFLAVETGHADTVAKLITHGANVNAVSIITGESLLYTAMRVRNRDEVETLLRHGADANHVNDHNGDNSETALHLAVKARDEKFTRFLLDIGADVNACDGNDATALWYANHGCGNIANVVIARVAMVKVCKGWISGRNEAIIGTVEEFGRYYAKCLEELGRIREMDLLDFLVKDVRVMARVVKRNPIVRGLKIGRDEVPVYYEDLVVGMERAEKRWRLMKDAERIVLGTADYFEELYDVMDMIVDNFTDDELEAVVKGSTTDDSVIRALGRSLRSGGIKAFELCDRRYLREPFQPLKRCPRWVCVEDAVKVIGSEQLVFIQGGAATPLELVRAMTEHGVCSNLRGVRLLHMALEGDAPFAAPEFEQNFRSTSLYIGANLRDAVNEGRADYIPTFNRETPNLFWHKQFVPDVALIHVSAPDAKGFCSLGTSVDCTRAAICQAKIIVAQVNEHMPRTFGDAAIHVSHFDWAVKHDCPLPCIAGSPPNDIEQEIGKVVSERLVEDGATLQLGIGNIPDAILCALGNHKDLGIHTEIFSDGMVDLVEKGCVTNKKKTKHKGRLVSSMAIGTKKLYDFIHNNPFISMLGMNYVNDPRVISKQHKMTAINSCIEMDITGQVCSDSLGAKFYSGHGGQLDFLTGAALSLDGQGKPIIAFASVTSKGESKIQPFLKLGGGVVATRAHAHYVVTEQGVAQLHGKTLRQRAYALIQIAHPDHRECLEKAAYDRLKVMPTKYL